MSGAKALAKKLDQLRAYNYLPNKIIQAASIKDLLQKREILLLEI